MEDTKTLLQEVERLRAENKELQSRVALLTDKLEVDPLTSAYNRGYFETQLREESQRASRSNSPLALMMVDADNFKLINDNYGHQTGDLVLQLVVSMLNVCCSRDTDRVCRYGGEEFMVILPNTNAQGSAKIADEVNETIAAMRVPHRTKDDTEYLSLTVSIGVSVAVNMEPEDRVKKADNLLYSVKHSGKNGYAIG